MNPLTACACGLLVCGLLTIGFGLSQPAKDDRSSTMLVAASLVEASLASEGLHPAQAEPAPVAFWQAGSSFGPALLAGPWVSPTPAGFHSE